MIAVQAWAEQVKSTEIIGDMAIRLAGLDGVPPAAPPGSEARSRRTAELVADLVEPAKAEAIDKLGEGHRAFDLAAGGLRAKLGIDPSSWRYACRSGSSQTRHSTPLDGRGRLRRQTAPTHCDFRCAEGIHPHGRRP